MSLVGSLEDLSLGDILQIISLSRKSGLLLLRSDGGEGRIIFREGLIRCAFRKGGPTDLRGLIAALEAVPQDDLDAACEQARAQGMSLPAVLVEASLLSAESLEEVRRANIEAAVMQMFRWATGEFSFEVRDDIPEEDIFSSSGVNPQYLALDFTRLADESGCDTDEDSSFDSLVFDGEDDDACFATEAPAENRDAAARDSAKAEEAIVTIEEEQPGEEPIVTAATLAGPEPMPAIEELPAAAAPSPAAALSGAVPPLVVIDADLASLEWVKEGLAETFPRVHIFQRSELGIGRIRQYLARAEVPLVLLSTNAPCDPLSGAQDAAEMIRRLRAQAPQMRIALLVELEADGPGDAEKAAQPDAIAEKPTPSDLADPRSLSLRAEYAERLRDLLVALGCESRARSSRSVAAESLSPDGLRRLKAVSARIRDVSSRGEVLPQVLQFASETLSRVAMFMVRGDVAQGIAQVGLPKAGGPDGPGLREVTLPRREPAWFRSVLDSRGPVRGAPSDEGDQRLAVLLGNAIPEEAYVAPIESGEHVVALLYADNLPGGEPIGDTSALEVVLHEAGLALDRAWLERALEEAEG